MVEAPHLVILNETDEYPKSGYFVSLAVEENDGGETAERNVRLLDALVILRVRHQHVLQVPEYRR